MAALDGFELSINTGDVETAAGTLDGAHVALATLDAAAIADGTAIVVLVAGVPTLRDAVDFAAGDVKLGEYTVSGGTASAVTYAGRGVDGPVSADETITL